MASDTGPLDQPAADQLRADLRGANRVSLILAGFVGALAVLAGYLLTHGGQLPQLPRLIVAITRIPDTPEGADAP